MKIIETRLTQIDGLPKSPIKSIQFSDSVILSSLNDADGVVHLVHFTSILASELFLDGIWCRGAITSGDLHHVRNEVYGPALIEAYDMESQLAIYPRILVTHDVADAFSDYKNRDLPSFRHQPLDAYFRRDFDNQLHLDIFSYKMFVPPKEGTIRETIKGVRTHIMEEISAPKSVTGMRVQDKLFWISKYLQYVDEVHGDTYFASSSASPPDKKTRAGKPARSPQKS